MRTDFYLECDKDAYVYTIILFGLSEYETVSCTIKYCEVFCVHQIKNLLPINYSLTSTAL